MSNPPLAGNHDEFYKIAEATRFAFELLGSEEMGNLIKAVHDGKEYEIADQEKMEKISNFFEQTFGGEDKLYDTLVSIKEKLD